MIHCHLLINFYGTFFAVKIFHSCTYLITLVSLLIFSVSGSEDGSVGVLITQAIAARLGNLHGNFSLGKLVH
jgi:hypothetical protein